MDKLTCWESDEIRDLSSKNLTYILLQSMCATYAQKILTVFDMMRLLQWKKALEVTTYVHGLITNLNSN